MLKDNDIRTFKNSFFYYVFFRLIRNFLNKDIIIKIFNFKARKIKIILLFIKKCDFGDENELNFIRKLVKLKILLLDCVVIMFFSLYFFIEKKLFL